MRTMPASYDCRAFGFEDKQSGLFYDEALNILLRGIIVDHMLQASVIHDGSDNETGRLGSSFHDGYRYPDWDLQHITHFPENILSLQGYLSWLNNPKTGYKQIKAYFKAKRLLEETLNQNNK